MVGKKYKIKLLSFRGVHHFRYTYSILWAWLIRIIGMLGVCLLIINLDINIIAFAIFSIVLFLLAIFAVHTEYIVYDERIEVIDVLGFGCINRIQSIYFDELKKVEYCPKEVKYWTILLPGAAIVRQAIIRCYLKSEKTYEFRGDGKEKVIRKICNMINDKINSPDRVSL